MRIGLIVDGLAEVTAFSPLKERLSSSTGHTIIGPVKAELHPKARLAIIANVVIDSVANLQVRKVDEVVLLIDREVRLECPGQLAERLAHEIQPRVTVPFNVVVKDRMFENWLVADTDALRAMRARFNIGNSTVRAIAPDKADRVDAHAILQSCARKDAYDKVQDARRILGHADVLRMAANSRSFRRFLRCVGHPVYNAQSRDPA